MHNVVWECAEILPHVVISLPLKQMRRMLQEALLKKIPD